MQQIEAVSALIGEIYDAALQPDLWPGVLGKTADYVGGPAAALFFKDAVNMHGNSVYDVGTDPHFKKTYFDTYIALDPSTVGHYFADIGEPIATGDLTPYDEFLQSRFYLEWARPQQFVDFIAAVLDKSVTSVAMVGVFRHERDGVVDDAARAKMRVLVPHYRRAVLIGRLMDLKTAEAATFADTFDSLAASMFLVDASGRIVHANAAGHKLLHAGDMLRTAGGRIIVTEASAQQALQDSLLAAERGDAAVGTKGIALPLTDRDGEAYSAHVLPLTSGARRATGIATHAVAAIFIHRAALNVQAPPELMAKRFRLTPTELRVLLAIVEVGGTPEVAQALGVAESTVKTHLKRVYEKTSVGRQADLVKLFAAFSNPMIG
jgi:DNA-binding CsgD family transcriptional regulator